MKILNENIKNYQVFTNEKMRYFFNIKYSSFYLIWSL